MPSENFPYLTISLTFNPASAFEFLYLSLTLVSAEKRNISYFNALI